MKNKPESYQSILAPYITGLLEEKRANGFSYTAKETTLWQFDEYCVSQHLDSLEVSKDFLAPWMERQDSESPSCHEDRISCVRQLMLYMASCGISVYIPHDFYHSRKPYPHIFDQCEIRDFFRALDGYQPRNISFEARLVGEYRMAFRLYCCCGMRNSEVVGAPAKNVDLDAGTWTVLDGKGNKDRIVYLPDDIRQSCRDYFSWLCNDLGFMPEWFFPAKDTKKHLRNATIDNVFTKFWNMTPHADCANKPTVHDFRFTFVVNRMNLWAEKGVDLKVMMPYLSRYLGHKTTKETFYYYYLVSDAYRTVDNKDSIACDVIPEVMLHG